MQASNSIGGEKLNYDFQNLYEMSKLFLKNIEKLDESITLLNSIDITQTYNKGSFISIEGEDGVEEGLGIVYKKDGGLISKKLSHLKEIYIMQCNQIFELIDTMISSDESCMKLYMQLEFGTYDEQTNKTIPMDDETYELIGGATLKEIHNNPNAAEEIFNVRIEEIQSEYQ